MKMTLKTKMASKIKTTTKIKMTQKWRRPQNKFARPLKRIIPAIFFMTSHLDSHRTTDIKPEMLSGVQTGNGTPHDKYNTRGIAHVRKNRKDDIFMHRGLGQIKTVPGWACTTLVVLVFLFVHINNKQIWMFRKQQVKNMKRGLNFVYVWFYKSWILTKQ